VRHGEQQDVVEDALAPRGRDAAKDLDGELVSGLGRIMCLMCLDCKPMMRPERVVRLMRLAHMPYARGMPANPTKPKKHRVPLIFSPEELQELDDWGFAHRHRTRTGAIKALMRLGYEASKAREAPPARKPRGKR
jgi:hypothetical protein